MKIFHAFILLIFSSSAFSQSDNDLGDDEEIIVTGSAIEKSDPEIITVIMDSISYLDLEEDQEVKDAARKLILAATIHETNKITSVKEALLVQKVASYVSFLIAHTLLFAGLFIGILEFKRVRKIKKRGESAENIEISIGVENIALKATMGATLALVFCFGFYTLYLVYVFPIATL